MMNKLKILLLICVILFQEIFSEEKKISINHFYFGTFSENNSNLFLYNLGSLGQNSQIKFLGFYDINFKTNGKNFSTININELPTENFHNIEMDFSTQSFLYGINSSFGTVNIKSKNTTTKTPITKIKYIESTYETFLFDGIFSKNFYDSLNCEIGIRRKTTDGRYTNSNDDEWNETVKLFFPNTNFDISFLQTYNKQKVGLFDGVDFNSSQNIFNPNLSQVVNLNDKLNFTRFEIDMFGKLFKSTSNEMEFTISNSKITYDTTNHNNHNDYFNCVSLTQNLNFEKTNFQLGANFENRNINKKNTNIFSYFAKNKFTILENMSFSLYGKEEFVLKKSHFSFGSDVNFKNNFQFGFSQSNFFNFENETSNKVKKYFSSLKLQNEITNFSLSIFKIDFAKKNFWGTSFDFDILYYNFNFISKSGIGK